MTQKAVSMQTRLAAVLAEQAVAGRGRLSVTALCAELEISRQTYYLYRRRFAEQGLDGLVPRSRRPHSSPRRISAEVEDAVVRASKDLEALGWDDGAISVRVRMLDLALGLPVDTGGELDALDASAEPVSVVPWELVPSLRTIHRVLLRRGLKAAEPAKRTRASGRRFEFPATDDCWQIDAYEYVLADGSKVVIFEVIDDHSRYLEAILAWPSEDGAGAWAALSQAIAACGQPRMVLSDNSLAFSGARRHRRVQFERNLLTLGVRTVTSRPGHPQTCGKDERHHQTSQRWLSRQPRPRTIAELQTRLDSYRHRYNHLRRHQGIGLAYPAARHDTGRRDPAIWPPGATAPEPTITTQHTVNARGQIRLAGTGIGLGAQWAGSRVTAFRTGPHLLVFHRDQLVRELTIDPTRPFQPTGTTRGGPRRTRIADTLT